MQIQGHTSLEFVQDKLKLYEPKPINRARNAGAAHEVCNAGKVGD